jgi:hypothetical protein
MSGGSAVRADAGDRGISRLGRKLRFRKAGNAPAASAAQRRIKALTAMGPQAPSFFGNGAQQRAGPQAPSLLKKRGPKSPPLPSPSREGSSPQGRNPLAGFGAKRRYDGARIEPSPPWTDAPDCSLDSGLFSVRQLPLAVSPSPSLVLLHHRPCRSVPCADCVCVRARTVPMSGASQNKEERR